MERLRTLIKENPLVRISYTAMMIALVFIATIVFSLYIPATEGFFNIGEAGVYIAAVTGGWFVGAVAGGIGSMLADLYLGYGVYAPATLVIKGLEGLIVGYLSAVFERRFLSGLYKMLGISIGLLVGVGLASLGNIFYLGQAEISLIWATNVFTVNISSLVWYVMGGIMVIVVIFLGRKYPEEIGYIVAMLIGGSEMVTGYFLYENFILGVAAYVEIPYNTMQMIIGLLISIITLNGLKKIL